MTHPSLPGAPRRLLALLFLALFTTSIAAAQAPASAPQSATAEASAPQSAPAESSAASQVPATAVPATPAANPQSGARALSLDQALELAHIASEDIGIAQTDVARARGDQKRARSSFFPQLSGSASYTRTLRSQFSELAGSGATTPTPPPTGPTTCPMFRPNPGLPIAARVDSLEQAVACAGAVDPFAGFQNLPFGRPNQYNFGLSASWQLFNLQTIGRAQAANAQVRSAEVGLTAAQAQVLLDVTQAYYDAALGDRLVAIAEATLRQADTTLAQAELARRVGNQSEFELLRARVTRDNQRPIVIQRQAQRDIAYLRLKQLLNIPLEQPIALTSGLGDTSSAALPAAIAALVPEQGDTNPDVRAPVRQANEAVASQRSLLKAARGEGWPSLVATSSFAQLAYPTGFLPNADQFLTDWTVGVGLSIPLFTGGRVSGGVQSARASVEAAELRLRQARKLALLDARSATTQLESALAAWEASQGTVEQARRAYEIAELRYREGLSTQTELNESRIQLQQAEANRAQTTRDLQVARTRLALLPALPLAQAQRATGATAAAASPGAAAATQTTDLTQSQTPTPTSAVPGAARTTPQPGATTP
ncbi:MAG TPA: TolC family protein [Gemmatimonadales bacterium]|nr:TolC family protein [Gemmatimonadales bacterium]